MINTYSPTAILSLREAILESDGNEVFFLGHTDTALHIWSVSVVARGNRQAVVALCNHCRSGDTVIHNHPGGDLTPSMADLEIAARLGELGIGFHIVDNAVENVYKVVDACPAPTTKTLRMDEIAALLGPQGTLASHLGNYEERPEQLRMTFAVAEAFNNDRLTTVEAGTGTGKSLAYLIPAILWSLRNDEPIAISTNTINLQEQLLRHDLPLLKKAIGVDFQAVLVKGRYNYLCLRRLDSTVHEPDLFSAGQGNELNLLREWAAVTTSGSRDDLDSVPSSALWAEVCCEMDQCPRTRCPHYSRCFFYKARRRAAHADLLIVNHALLLSDLAVRMQTNNYSAAAVLPPYQRIVIDEAHHLEDAATRNFSIQICGFSFARIINRLTHPRKQEQGQLPKLLSQLAKELTDSEATLYDALYQQIEALVLRCRALRDQAQEQFQQQREALSAQTGQQKQLHDGDFRWRITSDSVTDPRWQQLCQHLSPLARDSIEVGQQLEQLLKTCEQRLPENVAEALNASLTDIRGMAGRIACLGNDLHYFLSVDDQACTWLEILPGSTRHRDAVLWLNTAPISVAGLLKKAVYDRFRTIVLTSATLSVNRRFDYFNQRSGLELCASARRHELQLDSPFDFANQAVIAIPTDIVDPNHAAYAAMLSEQIEASVAAAQGRAFVLFTAYSLLRKIYSELDPPLHAQGLNCLRQGQTSRHQLLQQFKSGHGQVLFATDSFWEGVDVPGRALELVIITRLPFRVPSEPIQIARSEAITRNGGDPFMDYTVPQAVIRFKQGFGRLIRHRDDRGVVLILDKRVITKGYGRLFLNSLPAAQRMTAPAEQILSQLRLFFAQHPDNEHAPDEALSSPEFQAETIC